MHYLSIAAIARGESLYIKDWCTYHFGLQCEHIIIYDNELVPTYEKLLRPYFSEKQLTVIHWPGDTQQCPAITHCLNSNKTTTRFLSFIDVDEYLVPKNTNSLAVFLQDYEKYSCLCVHWVLYGSNGHKIYEPIPVVERFTRCANEVDRHVKSIVDPKRTLSWVTVHKFRETTPAVDEHFRPIADTDSRPEPATADKIRIAHFCVKSYEECLERRNRPRADIAAKHDFPVFFPVHDRNEIEDLRALNLWRTICGKQ